MNVELLKQLGNIGQIAGIRESRLLRGRGEGIAIAEFYNAAWWLVCASRSFRTGAWICSI